MPRVSTRSKEERIAEIDNKIQFYKDKIEQCTTKIKVLEEKKANIDNPSGQRKVMSNLIKAAKSKGMTAEDIAEKLGLELADIEAE
jgi:septal ring factor EnvC (AmiA/AmiB activator)